MEAKKIKSKRENNYIKLALLIYAASIVNMPQKVIKEINNVIQNYIWDCSRSKIAQQTLIQQILDGGLKVCHFETKVKAL